MTDPHIARLHREIARIQAEHVAEIAELRRALDKERQRADGALGNLPADEARRDTKEGAMNIDKAALDRYITGNWGEDQVSEDEEPGWECDACGAVFFVASAWSGPEPECEPGVLCPECGEFVPDEG
jgi:hypothetical protein